MKRIAAVATVLVMAFVLMACAPVTLAVETDDTGVHAVANNGAEGSGTGYIVIPEGHGLCINHIVNKGTFHVTATDSKGNVIFDEDLTDNIANLVPAQGDIDLVISAQGADGTVDIIAYDEEAQAQADAALGEALEQNGLSKESVVSK